MQTKRGQAALEFLMTYGWAILAAIIVIGVLAYFGVFSPGKFVPEATVVNPPFYANAWNIDANGGSGTKGLVSVEVRNNGGEDVEITKFQLSDMVCGTKTCDAINDTYGTLDGTVPRSLSIPAGKINTTVINCATALDAGDTCKGDVTITYTKTGSGLPLTSSGTIAAKVAP